MEEKNSRQPLCHIDDIEEGAALGFELAERNIFAVKKDNVIYVYENRCPHLGIELEYQENQFLDQDGALIQCSTHGALFLIEDGSCIAGPCMGDQLTAIKTEVVDDQLYLA